MIPSTTRPPVAIRRTFALLGVLGLVVAACGGAAGDPPTTPATTTGEDAATATTPGPTDTAAFPVAIEHVHGTTEIRERPQRVVSIGFVDHDPLLALGVSPVAVRDWFGEQPYATWPWARDELGDAEPVVLPSGELDLEQIASLEPDLIVGIGHGTTEQEYDRLSQIAPTLARPAEHIDYGVPWQDHTRMLGRAVGESALAEDLIADVEGQFAAVRDEHPEFSEATAVMGLVGNAAGEYSAYGPQDVRGRFLTSLGFEIPPQIVEAAGDTFYASLSRERLHLFDADVLLWGVAGQEQVDMLATDELYQALPVAQEGRDVFVEYVPLGGALSFSTVLSLPIALEEIVPRLVAALDGDPATRVPPAVDAATS